MRRCCMPRAFLARAGRQRTSQKCWRNSLLPQRRCCHWYGKPLSRPAASGEQPGPLGRMELLQVAV
jgi:hypothetical protein